METVYLLCSSLMTLFPLGMINRELRILVCESLVTKAAAGEDGPRLWKVAIPNVSYTDQESQ